ncbi:MAG: tetratricopeptide repeat protein [Candidatus Freyarchaeota archaeon]|nr:tetratricopeptide repeat protein [Candidatus Jordarchaeia archaeon]MBS7279999.1 tetratricopeptide repeat protein [Candidatus Jordarchaeia archaeon]
MSGKTEASRLLSEGKELIKKGDYEKAEKMFSEALKKFTKEDNNRGVAESETHLGIALQYQGKLKQAKEHLERALKLHEDLDYKPGISRVYTNLGNINLLTSKDFEKSLELHQKALNIAREAEDLEGEARALTNIGYVQFRQQKLDEALDTLNEALKIANKAKDDYIRAVALSNIGIILFNMKRYDEALEKHKEVAEIFEKWGNKKRLAIEHRQIGLILEKQNRYDEAAEHYQISQKLYDETGQKSEKKMVKSMLDAVKTRKRECPSCKTIILVPELKYCPICNKDL